MLVIASKVRLEIISVSFKKKTSRGSFEYLVPEGYSTTVSSFNSKNFKKNKQSIYNQMQAFLKVSGLIGVWIVRRLSNACQKVGRKVQKVVVSVSIELK